MATTVLRPQQALDTDGVAAFRESWAAACEDPATSEVVVDLAGVSFVDSTGLGALIRAREEAEDRGIAFRLARPRPQLERLLAMTATYGTFRWA